SHGALDLGFKVLWSKNEGTDEVLEGTAKVHESTAKDIEGTAQQYESTAEANLSTTEVYESTVHSLFKVLLPILKYCSLKRSKYRCYL
ncbi:hypothetical protein Tco_0486287, partial [Tanacetum coccineum]